MARFIGTLTMTDYDGQPTSTSLNLPSPVAGDFSAGSAILLSYYVAVEQVVDANFKAMNYSIRDTINDATSATQQSQRGKKWKITYIDESEFLDGALTVPNPAYLEPFSVEIPCADLSLRQGGVNIVWSRGASNNVALFDGVVTEFEKSQSPYGGSPQVQRIEAVGRAGG